jgi:YD repeat-containing protein
VMKDGVASTGYVQLTSTDGTPVEAFKRRDGRFVAYARTDGRLTRVVYDAAGRAIDEEVVARDVRYLHLVTLERGLHVALEVRPEAPVIGAAPRGVEVATAVAVCGW